MFIRFHFTPQLYANKSGSIHVAEKKTNWQIEDEAVC